tara:strand:- start:122 stop:439 length:318 start_codon:yes stop_codon:yes gene_type:complete
MEFDFILYTVPDCPKCEEARELILSGSDLTDNVDELKLSLTECSLVEQEGIDEFHRRYGHTTVPQVYLATEDEDYIGDEKDLKKFIEEMKLLLSIRKRKNTAVFI